MKGERQRVMMGETSYLSRFPGLEEKSKEPIISFMFLCVLLMFEGKSAFFIHVVGT